MKQNYYLKFLLLVIFFVFQGNILAQAVVIDPADSDPYYEAKKREEIRQQPQMFSLNMSRSASAAETMNSAELEAPGGYFELDESFTAIPTNDDGSFGPLSIPFSYNLYGALYSEVWINTNGNLTFNGPLSTFSASGFPIETPMVAPFWGDVDTSQGGRIYYKITDDALIVIWDQVAHYQPSGKTNTFQVIISDGASELTPPGRNTAFCSKDMQWTTGGASEGVDGFGGIPATVGINKGNGVDYVQVGRFDKPGADYDGPGGDSDGVDYLDNQCFDFNMANAENISPSANNLPVDNTVQLYLGETLTLSPSFIGPETNQEVTTTLTSEMCGLTYEITNGSLSTANITITGEECNLGINTITLESIDNGSPQENTITILTVEVLCSPVIASAKDITIELDESGNAVITPEMINNTSSNTCDITNLSLSQTDFDCSDIGNNTVTLTVTDTSGNISEDTAIVTVEDLEAPELSIQSLTRQLASINGLAVAATDFITSVNDNCSYTISPSTFSFDCRDVGTQQISITIEDPSGNQTIENASITIESPGDLVETSEGKTIISTPENSTVIDENILINSFDDVNGATVSINQNFQSGDELQLVSGFTLPTDVTSSYNNLTGVLTISGDMTSQELQEIFQNIQFRTSSSFALEREIIFNIGGGISNSDNDHYYEYVSGTFTWEQAKADAATRTLNGLQGYLATITSASENEFILTKLSDDGWIGGSDYFSQINSALGSTFFNNQSEAEGKWYWVTGPEAGTQFSEGAIAVNNQYANWNDLEPNNANGGLEHYAQIYFQNGGRWNDLRVESQLGYIVEYGGLADDQSCFSFSGTKVLELNRSPEITEINNIQNCPSEVYEFTIDITDSEDDNASLSVSATSANQEFIPNENISISFNGTNFDVLIDPIDGVQSTTSITLSASDSGNVTSTETFDFTTLDDIDPTVVTQNITVQLDENGEATIVPADIDNGSSDNCEIASMSLDIDSFGCDDVDAPVTVTLTVTDVNGNESTEIAAVTVEDNVDPTVVTQNITVQLDENGEATIVPADIDNGSSDNCEIVSMSLDIDSFGCDDVDAPVTVTLTVTDVNGNESNETAAVTVEDNVDPIVVTQNTTVQLDENGVAIITPGMIDNGSSDNCEIASMSLDIDSFDCDDVDAPVTVTLTVTDVNGNESTETAAVTVEDNVDPIVVTQNITVQLDENGDATIVPADIDNGSSDNCEIASMSLDIDSFGCDDVDAPVTVTLTVTDVNGNSSSETAAVTVEDNFDPIVVTQNTTVQLDENGEATIVPADIDNGSSDNCEIVSMSLDIDSFGCDDVDAPVTVTLTVTDVNGNESTEIAAVTVEDNVDPIVVTQNTTVQLDENGEATIVPADIDNGSSDNCEIASMSLDIDSFGCDDVDAPVTVTLTVTDVNGNSSSETAAVTVEDNVDPIVVTQNITVQLDENGEATIVPADIDNGSSDNCEIASMSLDIDSFGCDDVDAPVTVTLTVTDVNGNESTETAAVTVEDNVGPIVVTQNITVQLDAQGNATITPEDIDNGSSDACGISEMTLDITTFDVTNVGENTVVLTVEDNNGNISYLEAVVIVEDKVATVVVTTDITVELDAQGNVTITPEDIDNGSSDASGISEMTLNNDTFDCSNVGENIVVLTVTDNNGNESSLEATVTVEDKVAPVVVTQNITVQLDAQGNATITPQMIDNGSSDACGISEMTLDITTFDVTNVGENTVVLTVEDNNGNISYLEAVVIVEDKVAPVVVTTDITVELDAQGNVTITPEDIDNGSSDASGISEMTLNNDTFDCSNVGENIVVLTVTDNNGNESSLEAIVTVEDKVAPVVVTQNITVQLDAQGNATITPEDIDNGSFDACGISEMTLDITTFDVTNVGENTVVLTVEDNNGNISYLEAVVIVEDKVAPVVVTTDITVELDAQGNVTITPEDIDNGSSDASGISEMTLNNDTFDCSNVGENIVVLTVTDNNGNESSLEATVTVEDKVAPVPDVTEFEDVIVKCEVVPGRIIAPTATDNCAVLTATTLDPLTYNEPGSYTITWNFDDGNGNTAMQTQNVIVEPSPLNGVTFEDASFVYDGSEHSLEVKNLPAGASVDYTISSETGTQNRAINAGVYTVTANLSSGFETCPDSELNATLTILKAEAMITADVSQNFTYDGTQKKVNASLNHSEIELSYSPQEGFTEPGTYEITVTSAETENYLATTKEVSLVIEKAEITGVTFEGNTEPFVYNGSEHSIFVTGLPEDATVTYANNGKTNAGTYTVTAIVSQPGYEDLVLTANMLIEKASQSITFNELEDLDQLTDEYLQLDATSTSGLPVMYSYTYETEDPAATVGPRGFVRILGGGQITITATQAGNQNYEAAASVERTLTISGSEAKLVNAVINGTTYSNPSVDIYYLIGCGNSENEVQIELEQNRGSTIDRDNIFTMSTPAPGIYRETVIVTSEDGNTSTTYNIVVEKNFNFEDIVIQKFNNVLLVNNNPDTNGGYKFVSYRWYKDGSVIGSGQYYSAGNNVDDQLDDDSSYYVVLETEDGEFLRTCISSIQLRSSLNISLAPNPVSSGGTMELLADFPKNELETMHLSIHNLNGMLIKKMKSNNKITSITLPYNLQMGVYILKIRTENIDSSVKFIIK
ncbi:nidogen-like domain-containing protein [Salegentibacter sp. Hel_I_6]|uniref:nidogen-like domain-containing protein n=1 Tax=Salegentibacter sp. Hel_I_6 TaxID=1250278 RepID=UPI00055B6011|nr:nidogen-like domain-containing protein [Salegentibacter sp. Hel_I_6]